MSDVHDSRRLRTAADAWGLPRGHQVDPGRRAPGPTLPAGTVSIARAPRVLQVVLSLDPGGTERLVIELTKRLHRELPMAVCCLDDPGEWAASVAHEGVRVTALNRADGFRPGLGRALAAVAREHKAAVLHCHHYSPFVYGALARLWRPGLRIVFTEHGRLSDKGPSAKRRLANRVLHWMPHAVFAVSAELREHLIEEGFPARSVGVIYNGIETGSAPLDGARASVRACLGVGDETLVIGTIARLDPVKSLDTLIHATAELARERPVMLVIIGDGPERAALLSVAEACGAGQRVQFLGQRHDARAWLAGFDVYANSSISEGVSLTILEAMAAALPIVATRVGGTPEVLEESCGRLVPARSVVAMIGALRDLAGAPELRRQLGAAARRRLEDRFTIERMVRDYRDVYCGVA